MVMKSNIAKFILFLLFVVSSVVLTIEDVEGSHVCTIRQSEKGKFSSLHFESLACPCEVEVEENDHESDNDEDERSHFLSHKRYKQAHKNLLNFRPNKYLLFSAKSLRQNNQIFDSKNIQQLFYSFSLIGPPYTPYV